MSRFSQPLQGKAPTQAKRIRPAFYGCLIGVGISQFFYPHVRPDNVDPISGSSFVPAVIESCDRGVLAVYRHKEDRASDAFSFGFAKRSGLDNASIGQSEGKARKAVERGAGRDLEDREWIQMKAKLTEFCTILQDWQKQALTDRKAKKL
jgi:hypothetical protein